VETPARKVRTTTPRQDSNLFILSERIVDGETQQVFVSQHLTQYDPS